MALGDVSTKTIPEIDLKRSVDHRLAKAFGAVYGIYASGGEVSLASTDADSFGVVNSSEPYVAFYTAGQRRGTAGMIQSKPAQLQHASTQEELEGVASHITIDDLASFIVPVSAGQSDQWHAPHRSDQATVRVNTLAKRMRFIAEGALSRPIFNIEEAKTLGLQSVQDRTKPPITVSSSLQRKTSVKQSRGLGHVSAGLLLWLESAEADDSDM